MKKNIMFLLLSLFASCSLWATTSETSLGIQNYFSMDDTSSTIIQDTVNGPTLISPAKGSTEGRFGSAAVFNGINTIFSEGLGVNGKITINMWVNKTSLVDNTAILKISSSFAIVVKDNVLGFTTFNDDLFGISLDDIPTGIVMMTFVIDKTTNSASASNKIYVNGVPQTIVKQGINYHNLSDIQIVQSVGLGMSLADDKNVIALSDNTSCAVLKDGTVKCWGLNYGATPQLISGIVNAKSIAAGLNNTFCAVLKDGTVKCWGYSGVYTAGVISSWVSVPNTISGITDAVKVSVGSFKACALTSVGTVKCWGQGQQGAISVDGINTYQGSTAVTQFGIVDAVDVSVGTYLSACAVLKDGTVKCWGDLSSYGQHGQGSGVNNSLYTNTFTPISIPGLTTAKKVEAGYYSFCVLLEDKTEKCWGYGYNGGIVSSQSTVFYSPTLIPELSGVSGLVPGQGHCHKLAFKDDKLVSWGCNHYQQLGQANESLYIAPLKESMFSNVKSVGVGGKSTCFGLDNGDIKCLGGTTSTYYTTPIASSADVPNVSMLDGQLGGKNISNTNACIFTQPASVGVSGGSFSVSPSLCSLPIVTSELLAQETLSENISILPTTLSEQDVSETLVDESLTKEFTKWSNNDSIQQNDKLIHGMFGIGSIEKTFEFPSVPNQELTLSLDYYAVDGWQKDDFGFIEINDIEVWRGYRQDSNTCSGWMDFNKGNGDDPWDGQGNQRCYKQLVFVGKTDSRGNLKIKIGGELSQTTKEESWGVGNIKVQMTPKIPDMVLSEKVVLPTIAPTATTNSNPKSCMEIKFYYPHLDSGTYTIYPDGLPIQVYCDMDTDGGGWTRIIDENGYSSFSGWTNNNKTTQMNTSTHGMFAGGYIEKTFNITIPHDKLRVGLNYFALDSWDGSGEYGYVNINGTEFWNKYRTSYSNCSGWSNFNGLQGNDPWSGQGNQRCYESLTFRNISSTTNNIVIRVGSTINQAVSDESWGFSNLFIDVKDPWGSTTTATVLTPGLENEYVSSGCDEIKMRYPASISGLYSIVLNNSLQTVYCDMDTDGGGWTVIQRRMDGSQNFYLPWSSYKIGFGTLNGEFYLGNDNISAFTNSVSTDNEVGVELRVDLKEAGVRRYATYRDFKVLNESNKYRMYLDTNSYVGDAGDSLTQHSGYAFSTYDRDNDTTNSNCAVIYTGAWWYSNCHSSNLNGKYGDTGFARGPVWYAWLGHYTPLDFTEMKVRRFKPMVENQKNYYGKNILKPRTCLDLQALNSTLTSGSYLVYPDGSTPMPVYCNMSIDGGGWTMVWSNLRSFDGAPMKNMKDGAVFNNPLRVYGSPTSTSQYLGGLPNNLEVFGGLNWWNKLLLNTTGNFMYLWKYDQGYTGITEGFKSTITPFASTDGYKLKLSNYSQLYGSITAGLWSYHNGRTMVTYEQGGCGTNYSNTPFWYKNCWDGSINGGGINSGGGYYDGAYWDGSDKMWASSSPFSFLVGRGAGAGYYYVKPNDISPEIKKNLPKIEVLYRCNNVNNYKRGDFNNPINVSCPSGQTFQWVRGVLYTGEKSLFDVDLSLKNMFVDDLAIWNRELSSTEIQIIENSNNSLDNTLEGGSSCMVTKQKGATKSGRYFLKPSEASPFLVTECEMSIDGGGWSLVAKVSNQDSNYWSYVQNNWTNNTPIGTLLQSKDYKNTLWGDLSVDDLLILEDNNPTKYLMTGDCMETKPLTKFFSDAFVKSPFNQNGLHSYKTCALFNSYNPSWTTISGTVSFAKNDYADSYGVISTYPELTTEADYGIGSIEGNSGWGSTTGLRSDFGYGATNAKTLWTQTLYVYVRENYTVPCPSTHPIDNGDGTCSKTEVKCPSGYSIDNGDGTCSKIVSECPLGYVEDVVDTTKCVKIEKINTTSSTYLYCPNEGDPNNGKTWDTDNTHTCQKEIQVFTGPSSPVSQKLLMETKPGVNQKITLTEMKNLTNNWTEALRMVAFDGDGETLLMVKDISLKFPYEKEVLGTRNYWSYFCETPYIPTDTFKTRSPIISYISDFPPESSNGQSPDGCKADSYMICD